MRVTARKDERRAHRREYDSSRQLRIIVDGQNIMTENWSIGGFRTHGLFRFARKDRFSALVALPKDGTLIPFTGQIVRVEEDGARIVSLVEIDLDHLLALHEGTAT